MKSHYFISKEVQRGDQPIDPLTDQSFQDDPKTYMTQQAGISDIGQSYSSFQPRRLIVPLVETPTIKDEINQIQPSFMTKYSEKLFQDVQQSLGNRVNNVEMLLSERNVEEYVKSMNPSSKKAHVTAIRLNAQSEQKIIQKQLNVKIHQDLELVGCTFKPSLNVKSISLAKQTEKNYVNSPPRYMSPRNTSNFYNQKQQENIKSINEIKEKRVQPKPNICEKSKQLVENRDTKERENKENVFERLNQRKIQVQQSTIFLNISNKNLSVNPIQVSQKLYEDAFRKKKIRVQYYEDPKPIKSDQKKSQRLQTDYLVKEFYSALTNARKWSMESNKMQVEQSFQFDLEDLCLMTLDEMVIVMDYLGFLPLSSYRIENPNNKAIQLFKLLICPNNFSLILTRNLLTFLLAVAGIKVGGNTVGGNTVGGNTVGGGTVGGGVVPFYTNVHNIPFPEKYSNELLTFENGNLVIKEPISIQKSFKEYYLSHLSYNKKQVQPSKNSEASDTVRNPNTNTEFLAKSFRNRLKSILDQKQEIKINDFAKIYSFRKENSMRDMLEREMEDCTFRPKINKHNRSGTLFQKPTEQVGSIPRPAQLISFERQRVDCTFTPDISRSQSSHLTSHQSSQNASIVQSSQDRKVVERMIKGRVERRAGEIASSMGRAISPRLRAQIEKQALEQEIEQTMHQVVYTPKNGFKPLLYIDVSLENNRVDRITIMDGDIPQKLAQDFALKHNLTNSMRCRLVQLLEEQMNILITHPIASTTQE